MRNRDIQVGGEGNGEEDIPRIKGSTMLPLLKSMMSV